MSEKIIPPDCEPYDKTEWREAAVTTVVLGDPPSTRTVDAIFGCQAQPQSLLQEWTTHFIGKQQDYRDTADDLGAPGQYAELHRKIGKLKRALWEGKPLVGEPAREVLMDLIGHCFLAVKHLDENNFGGKGE